MAAADIQRPPTPPSVPDYMLDCDAVMRDEAHWRYGKAPDYSMTRKAFQQGKTTSHPDGSLESMVQNLVKNWEVEASHKMKLSDWRTVDPEKYTFAVNGGPAQPAEHMLKVGTYNAIIAASQYYDPKNFSLARSHHTFRNMMPAFAWEVLEVYSPPPVVAFKWRHWGVMEQNYVGWNDKGEKVTIKAHGQHLEVFGITVANLNDKLQVTKLETWFDPIELFNQMKPDPASMKIEIDNVPVSNAEVAEILERPRDDSTKEIVEQATAGTDIVNVMSGASLVDQADLNIFNPTIPGAFPHNENKNHNTGNSSTCPFLTGRSRSH